MDIESNLAFLPASNEKFRQLLAAAHLVDKWIKGAWGPDSDPELFDRFRDGDTFKKFAELRHYGLSHDHDALKAATISVLQAFIDLANNANLAPSELEDLHLETLQRVIGVLEQPNPPLNNRNNVRILRSTPEEIVPR